jgi:hypothetical protein
MVNSTDTYSQAYSDELKQKIEYIKTPATIDLEKTLKNDNYANYNGYSSYNANSVNNEYNQPATETTVSDYVPRAEEKVEQSIVSEIPFFEHEGDTVSSDDSARSHAERFMAGYADISEVEEVVNVIEPAETYRPIPVDDEPVQVQEEIVDSVVEDKPISSSREEIFRPFADETVIEEEPIQEVIPEIEEIDKVQEEQKNSPKKMKSFSVIGLQIAVIGILIATIFLTNAFYPKSGINVLLNEVFSVEQVDEIDTRTYKDFAPVLAVDDNIQVVLDGGMITLTGKSSVYCPCDGKVSSVVKGEDGKFSITVEHNKNFSTVLSGLDNAFCAQGDSVFSNIPVGFIRNGGAQMCFYGAEGQMISDYQLQGSSVVWAV